MVRAMTFTLASYPPVSSNIVCRKIHFPWKTCIEKGDFPLAHLNIKASEGTLWLFNVAME